MSTNTYIVAPKLNKLGFISTDSSDLRIKQGLAPQTNSNTCVYVAPNSMAYPTNGIPEGAYYNKEDMRDYCGYSSEKTELSFGIPIIPNDCPCLDYIRSQ
jgi:hypothetical protein